MLKEIHHIGIGVEDLKKAVWFYTEVLEMDQLYKSHNEGKKISRIVDVEDAFIDVCFVQKNNVRLELLQYKKNSNGNNRHHIKQNELGLIHLSFLVDDVDKEYERIKAYGFEFNSPPMVAREDGPKITYLKGPDNVVIELYEALH